MLLQVTAGIEHDLMVQYLYAAYSLGGPEAKDYPDEVRRWRDTMLAVALEEMGHLLTVQNLLLLVGGPVTFERHHYGWSFNFQPFKFKLEPLSMQSLALYFWAEAQPRSKDEIQIEQAVRDQILMLMPERERWTRLVPVGWVYTKLIDLVSEIPDSTFDPASYPYQATWDEFARGHRPHNAKPYRDDLEHEPVSPGHVPANIIVTPMATRTEALAALGEIAAQGEGLGLTKFPHAFHFMNIMQEWGAIRSKLDNKTWSPTRLVCENPHVWEPPQFGDETAAIFGQVDADRKLSPPPGDRTLISSESTRKWAALFNFRYRMLLSLLTYLFRVPRGGPSGGARRAQILSRLFGEMYNMKTVAGILVRLPVDDSPDSKLAGPPFQLPYTLGQSLSKASFWRMHLDLLDSAAALADELLTQHASKTPSDGKRYLALMRETDRESRRWIERTLEVRED
jgi:hypothetical protein